MNEHDSACTISVPQDMSESISIRVGRAVAELLVQHEPVSFYSVAEQSAVSRSTLYRREDLRRLVCRAREGKLGAAGSDDVASEIARLELENAKLRRELEEVRRERMLLQQGWQAPRQRQEHALRRLHRHASRVA